MDTVARLAEIPNILGVKDSSGDLQNTNELIRAVPPRFAVLMGRDTLIFSALMFGAAGAVPATANIAPALLVEIYNAFQRGDVEASKAAQLRLNPLRLALSLCTAPGAVRQRCNAGIVDGSVSFAGGGLGGGQTAGDARRSRSSGTVAACDLVMSLSPCASPTMAPFRRTSILACPKPGQARMLVLRSGRGLQLQGTATKHLDETRQVTGFKAIVHVVA